jgi:hypothetical protein
MLVQNRWLATAISLAPHFLLHQISHNTPHPHPFQLITDDNPSSDAVQFEPLKALQINQGKKYISLSTTL